MNVIAIFVALFCVAGFGAPIVIPPGSKVGLSVTLNTTTKATDDQIVKINKSLPGLLSLAFSQVEQDLKTLNISKADITTWMSTVVVSADWVSPNLTYSIVLSQFPAEHFAAFAGYLDKDKAGLVKMASSFLALLGLCPPTTIPGTTCTVINFEYLIQAAPLVPPSSATPSSTPSSAFSVSVSAISAFAVLVGVSVLAL